MSPLVQVSGATPFAECALDEPERQPGHQFPGSEVEPRLALNPQNPLNLVGVFQQDRWSNSGARGLMAAASFDGGATWRATAIPGLTYCTGGASYRASDPWVSFAPNGDVHAVGLVLDLGPDDGQSSAYYAKSGMAASRSTDGGLTWSEAVVLAVDRRGALHDKGSIAADPTDAASRFVYAVWDRIDEPGNVRSKTWAMFARSTDAGRTWEGARVIYDPGQGNSTVGHQILVLPDGTLLNFFTEYVAVRGSSGAIQRYDAFVSWLRSENKGQTWQGPQGRPLRVASLLFGYASNPDGSEGREPDVRTGVGLVDVAVDRVTGRLYVVWEDRRFDASAGNIAFSMSADGGFTWSTPVRVNQTPAQFWSPNRQAFTPSVSVASDGTIGVTYYDFRSNEIFQPGATTDYWLVRCRPVTATACTDPADWTDEVRLTDASFDLENAPVARGLFVGDYAGLATDGDDFLALFAQPHGSDPASLFFRRVRP